VHNDSSSICYFQPNFIEITHLLQVFNWNDLIHHIYREVDSCDVFLVDLGNFESFYSTIYGCLPDLVLDVILIRDMIFEQPKQVVKYAHRTTVM